MLPDRSEVPWEKGKILRFLIQVVQKGSVTIDGNEQARIGKGFVVLIGVSARDIASGHATEIADKMTKKMLGLRVFADENGKTNLSLADVKGSLLLVSQFTLYADCRRGNRPGFTYAGEPETSERIYQHIIARCKETVSEVQTGVFGADMKVALVNDGPFTVMLDSEELGYEG